MFNQGFNTIANLSDDLPLRIAITTGEPAGVGPELMYYLASLPIDEILQKHFFAKTGLNPRLNALVELVLIGDYNLLHERMTYRGGKENANKLKLVSFDAECLQPSGLNSAGEFVISCYHVPLKTKVKAGKLDEQNAQYVLDTLDIAIKGCMSKTFAALVTAPISKSVIAKSALNFTGHTEYLQEKTQTDEVVMMLGCDKLNVALATTHLPLKEVSAAITKDKLEKIITVLHNDLKLRFAFDNPTIIISGLNPHAGEDGCLGREEIETIIPVVEKLKSQNKMNLIGPLPADTIFQKKYMDKASAFLTMYHDQGLPVLKCLGFESGYNTTLGLPFIRTSVDHGTALDLAARNIASPGSLLSATSLAINLAQQERLSTRLQ